MLLFIFLKLITELEPLDERLKPEIEELLTKSQILCQNGKILCNDRFAFFQGVRGFFNCLLYDLLVLQKLLRRVIGERVRVSHLSLKGFVQFWLVASNFR